MSSFVYVGGYQFADAVEAIEAWLSQNYDYKFPIGLMSYGTTWAAGTFLKCDDMYSLAEAYYQYLIDWGILDEAADDLTEAVNATTFKNFLGGFDLHEGLPERLV